jgi:hypothetical protein
MVGGPQVQQIANPQICGLRIGDLPQMWQFLDLRFADPVFFAICGPNLFCDLRIQVFADLRLADWHIYEICGFWICGSIKENCGFAISGLAVLRNGFAIAE